MYALVNILTSMHNKCFFAASGWAGLVAPWKYQTNHRKQHNTKHILKHIWTLCVCLIYYYSCKYTLYLLFILFSCFKYELACIKHTQQYDKDIKNKYIYIYIYIYEFWSPKIWKTREHIVTNLWRWVCGCGFSMPCTWGLAGWASPLAWLAGRGWAWPLPFALCLAGWRLAGPGLSNLSIADTV